ncbi:MAG: gliding motility-associated lipoprotein GldJ [Bacteroidetes bacterium]|nr:gliding motility-associated lipoprotein GldJ [Bacteroidota bacterium]
MKKRSIFLVFLLSVLLFSFSKKRKLTVDDMGLPPGSIRLSSNFYIDKNEVRNLDYLEFMHWVKKVFGEASPEYKSILPDTSSWKKLGPYYNIFSSVYLVHPAFRHAPVVGVSYAQAKEFCKWRSDRVMEFLLIRERVVKHDPFPTKENYFTIEKYFSGHYKNISPNPARPYYPVFELPDSAAYMRALSFSDSLYKTIKNENRKALLEPRYFDNTEGRSDSIKYGTEPVKYISGLIFKKNLLADLRGNVRELTSDSTLTFGGSYIDSGTTVQTKLFYPHSGSNCYTGFRNVCHYKKWTTFK